MKNRCFGKPNRLFCFSLLPIFYFFKLHYCLFNWIIMQYYLQNDQQKLLVVLELVGFHSLFRSGECSDCNNESTHVLKTSSKHKTK